VSLRDDDPMATALDSERLTFRSAQQSIEPSAGRFFRFANPSVVCEGWYPIASARRLAPGTVKRAWIGPTDIVLYRDRAGRLGAVERACPHLGADLALGRVAEKGLQCAFHLWCWSADGTCVSGGGAALGRRIRAYAVRERWGLVWIWAGGSPRYELPEPDPSNARFVLRLPQARLRCHPHVMLGNGLDFTHVAPVHRFQLLEDPAVELDPPFKLAVSVHGRFGPTPLRRLLGLTGVSARWRFTTVGPSLSWLSVESPIRFELLWSGRPLPDGSCAARTIFFLPRRRAIATAVSMMIATTWHDRRVLRGLEFRPGFVRSDAVFYLYARLVEAMPRWLASDVPLDPA
jgi:phenylpropionate dioxygenase-like ring-hydroxylating dioxygenase large terminal subunit